MIVASCLVELIQSSDTLLIPLRLRNPELLSILHNVCKNRSPEEDHMFPSGWIFDSDFEILRSSVISRLAKLSIACLKPEQTFNLDPSPPRTLVRYSCFISFSNLDGNPGYIELPPLRTMCLYSSCLVSTAAAWMVWNRSSAIPGCSTSTR